MAINRSSDPFGSLAPRIMGDLMRDFGLRPEQAAGVVGNLAAETGGFRHMQELNPIVPGSRGGYGWAQWTGPRRRQFESFVQERGLDPNSYEANYGFLSHELSNTPEGRVLGALRQAHTASDAAQVFSEQFLRPGIPHMDSRKRWADRSLGLPDAGQGAPPGPPMDITPPQVAQVPADEPQGIMGLLGAAEPAAPILAALAQGMGGQQEQAPAAPILQLAPMPQAQSAMPSLPEYLALHRSAWRA